jgi:predicted nucleic acid-binding protein
MAKYLIDKSAFARIRLPLVGDRLEPLIVQGRIAVTGIGMIEILFSAQNTLDFENDRVFLSYMPRVSVTERIVDRALDIQHLMVRNGTHRAVGVPDLVLAACAESHGLTLLHYDSDFDLIAAVTDQPTEWVVPAGSVS